MIVTTTLGTPYTMLREDYQTKNLTGNDRYEGYIVDLVEAVADILRNNIDDCISTYLSKLS